MLHKHKRSDMCKRSLLQKKLTGEWYEQHLQNGVRRGNSPLSSAPTAA